MLHLEPILSKEVLQPRAQRNDTMGPEKFTNPEQSKDKNNMEKVQASVPEEYNQTSRHFMEETLRKQGPTKQEMKNEHVHV